MEKTFYKLSRFFGKVGTFVNDAKVISTGDPKKIAKRFARKHTYQQSHKGANKLSRKIIDIFKLKG